MTVWTLSSERGAGAHEVAQALAEALEVPDATEAVAVAVAGALRMNVDELAQLEQRVSKPMQLWVLGATTVYGSAALVRSEMDRILSLREATEHAFHQAARLPCLVMGRAGFSILARHPHSYHIRLWAPIEWRAKRRAARECIRLCVAREMLKREDRACMAYVRRMRGVDVRDPRHFHLVVNASRFRPEEIADMIAIQTRPSRSNRSLSL
jgi:cytidylate kinase